MFRLPVWCLALLAVTSCHVSREVPLRIRGLRLDPLVHDCYLVNVAGVGVSPTYATADFPSPITPQCLGLGTTSALLSADQLTSSQGVSLRVKPGLARVVEVLGIKAGAACAGKSLPRLFDGQRPEVYRLGNATVNLLTPGSVTVENTYLGPGEPDRTDLCPTAVGNRVLALTEAYHGGLSINPTALQTVWGELLGAFRPMPLNYDGLAPPHMAGVPDGALLTTRWATQGTGAPDTMHGRVDLLFSVEGIDVSDYGGLKVRATILGGTVSYTGACNLADTVSNPAVEMRIRKGLDWEDVGASHANGTPTEVSFEVSDPQGYVRTLELYQIGTTAPYLHLSVRRTGGVPDLNCSFAQVDSLQVELVP